MKTLQFGKRFGKMSRLSRFALLLPLMMPILGTGCASHPKAEIAASASPNEEMNRLRRDIAHGEANDYAVLDRENFEKSQKYLERAEQRMRNNDSQAKVLEELRIARGYFQRADERATHRRSLVESVLDTRTAAIRSGAMKFPQSRQVLERADSELREVVDDSRAPSAQKVQELQSQYSDTQLIALEIEHLGPASAMIHAAEEQDARSKAPQTLNQAKVDYLTARNAISTNRELRAAYSPAVRQANLSADTLSKVMQIAARDGSRFNEGDAVRMVWQDRRIHSLDQELARTDSERNRIQFEMSSQAEALQESRNKVALQQALVEAQERFTPDEAEVYQQGNNLLIRLKAIQFPVGSAKIPEEADPLLNKVQAVVSDLQPSKVVVQGHTDSTGTPQINEKLSEKRAEEVAAYLEKNGVEAGIAAEGLGASKPLANNKTREGRAQNRRIDLIVTPGRI